MANLLITANWSDIQIFLAVADCGSLSSAARELGLSQPTLGRRIRAMEDLQGSALFSRDSRGLKLTELGRALYGPAANMREAARQLELSAAGGDNRMSGTVRVTASMIAAQRFLPRIIADLREAEPDIAIELVASDTSDNLLFREADIAVRMYRPQQLDIVSRFLGDITLALFGSRRYFAQHGVPDGFESLKTHSFVGYDRNDEIIKGMREVGWPVSRDWFKTRCDDQNSYWELMRAGCGLGFGPQVLGAGDPELVEVPIPGVDLPVIPVWLAAHEGLRRTPRIRRVWDALAEGLRPLVIAAPA